MNTLISHHHFLRENAIFLLGVCLCFYFSYHALLGHRSIIRLYALEKQIETLSQKKQTIMKEQYSLQKKVVMMRPGSVDKDLLEERVRITLGYRQADEVVILDN